MKTLIALILATAAAAFGQTAAQPMPVANQQFLDCRTGICVPLNGGMLFSYAAGTTTPLNTYTSSAGTTPNSNPVVLNSSGFNSAGSGNAGVWIINQCYKFELQDSDGVDLWIQDNVCNQEALMLASLAGSGGAALIGYKQVTSSTLRTVQSKIQEDISPLDFGADPTGAIDATAAIQAALNLAAGIGRCVIFNGGTYKVSGSLTSPALGQLCMRGNYNAVPYTGVLSGTPPRSASLIQQTNNAKTIKLTGLSNVVDGMDVTIATGVTGVTGIYGIDTVSQPFAHNHITNNTIHGYSSGVTAGTHLATGIDIESIGANANNNTLSGNVVEVADTCYILHGASTSAVVNANIFHNWANNCNDAAILTNAGEMGDFWLSMEGNTRAVTGVGIVASNFYLDNGEQAPPHLMLSGGSHDNTLWSAQRNRNAGQIGMTVSADSTPNALNDLSGFWQAISSTGQRFWMFGGVGESSSQTPNLSIMQHTSDTSGSTRSTYRIAHSVNFNSVSDLSITPQGCDSLSYCGLYFGTEASYDFTKPLANLQQFGTQAGNSPYAFMRIGVSGNLLGEWICNSVNTAARFDTACGFRLNARNTSNTLVTPFIVRGDGLYLNSLALPGAAFLESCVAGIVGATVPNYPFATSKTRGAAPGSGGTFNVSIRCATDDAISYAWVIQ